MTDMYIYIVSGLLHSKEMMFCKYSVFGSPCCWAYLSYCLLELSHLLFLSLALGQP